MAIPSLNPSKLRGVPVGPRRAFETVDPPPGLHGSSRVLGDVTKGVHHRIGVVGAYLHAEVALASGPGPGCRSGSSPCGTGRGRPLRREAEAVIEQAGAHPEDKRRRPGGQHRPQDAVVVRWRRWAVEPGLPPA